MVYLFLRETGTLENHHLPYLMLSAHSRSFNMAIWRTCVMVTLLYLFDGVTSVTIADFIPLEINGKMYLLSKGTASYFDAKTQCLGVGSDLALFDTNAEYFGVSKSIDSYFDANKIQVDGMWIDLKIVTTSKISVQWRNETLSSLVWYPGDPNGNCKDTSKTACCARIDWDLYSLHDLRDTSCDTKTLRYLCIPKYECSDWTNNCSQICLEKIDGYRCDCNPGYALESDGRRCKDFDECLAGTYQCEYMCHNTFGSYTCSCRSGYYLGNDTRSCLDQDECAVSSHGCQHFCNNTAGSFACACHSGYQLALDGHSCDDIDECLSNNSGCKHECANSVGSFICSCDAGFALNATDQKSCSDKNECDNKNICQHNCTNIDGSYMCSCSVGYSLAADQSSCYDVNECQNSSDGCVHVCNNTEGSYECLCHPGYVLDIDKRSCSDVDECLRTKPCEQMCENTPGSYECTCTVGYTLSSDNNTCQDLNECELDKHDCAHICINTRGNYSCSCDDGYFLGSDHKSCIDLNDCKKHNESICGCAVGFRLQSGGTTCEDIDECEISNDPCHQKCTNTEGSYVCSCELGYGLTEDTNTTLCVDIDECATTQLCPEVCTNTDGSYFCGCPPGFIETHETCEDIDECLSNSTHNCSQTFRNATGSLNSTSDMIQTDKTCFNTNGSYYCSCPDGSYPDPGGSSFCFDINECEMNASICEHTCNNTIGSYFCTRLKGFKLQDNGSSCNKIPTRHICPCSCAGRRRYLQNTYDTDLAIMMKDLTINRKNLLTYRISKISIPDHRPASQAIGYSGLVLICVLFGCVVFVDALQILLSFFISGRASGKSTKPGTAYRSRKSNL